MTSSSASSDRTRRHANASSRPAPRTQPASASLHFIAGLSSGVLSAVLLQPADLLKTRVQQADSHGRSVRAIVRQMWQQQPQPQQRVRQLWRGTLPSTLRTGLGSALYFSSLNALRQRVGATTTTSSSSSSSLPQLSPVANLTTGAVARASIGFVMMPSTVLKVRYESSLYPRYRSLGSACADIWRHEGTRGFFVGYGATAVRDAPYAGLYVLFYEQCKTVLGRVLRARSGAGDEQGRMTGVSSASLHFVSGAVAAGLATALTNPFDVLKTRIQLQPGRYRNMCAAASQMLRSRAEGGRGGGWGALWDGLGLRMAKKALSSALAWTLYEELVSG
ncbi:MAG: hypothetical protein M1826_005411 [Phylliscum demangeonii]|nr:MAG: hypothetical protein M1826_005411 [Phylliscum demangeonii]